MVLIPGITSVLVIAVPCSFMASHVISRTVSVDRFLIVSIDTSSSHSSTSDSSLGTISTPFSYQRTLGFGVPLTLTTRRLMISSSSSSQIVSVCNSVSKNGDFPIVVSSIIFVSSLSSSSEIYKSN